MRRAAKLVGLPVWQTKLTVYVLSGMGADLAGVILSSQVRTATYGVGAELDVIAAHVVGGRASSAGPGPSTARCSARS